MKQDSLLENLQRYSREGAYPFHMPGHKRNPPREDGLPWRLDITEIDGFDDLHHPVGILQAGMERAARLWGSRRAFFLVGGSTCGILAAIRAVAPEGSRVLTARNCHRSVFHGIELCRLRPVYLTPPVDRSSGIWGSLSPRQVEEALDRDPQIALVILTSPTYEGVLSDVGAIAALCHRRGIPLLVDEAHGAHLGVSSAFGPGAVAAGADLVVQSLHKTLPSLTQTALLHLQGELVAEEEVARQLSIFQSSSPSYPLMASIDQCIRLVEEEGSEWFPRWKDRLARFSRQVEGLERLRVLCNGKDRPAEHPAFWGMDPSKLVISTRGTSLTGPQLKNQLRERYALELEMAQGEYALAMTGLWDREEGMDRLARALLTIDGQVERRPAEETVSLPEAPPQILTIAAARKAPGRLVPLSRSAGAICREYVWAYPPGIPLLAPGQQVTGAVLRSLAEMASSGVELHSTSGRLPEELEVVRSLA